MDKSTLGTTATFAQARVDLERSALIHSTRWVGWVLVCWGIGSGVPSPPLGVAVFPCIRTSKLPNHSTPNPTIQHPTQPPNTEPPNPTPNHPTTQPTNPTHTTQPALGNSELNES